MLVSASWGCASPAEPVAPVPAAPVVAAAPAPVNDSIYALNVPLVGEDGRRYGLDVERGHLVLMSMFYTTCPMACPLLIERIKGILDEAGPAASDARVLLVSMDPARDDVAALRQAWTERGLDSRWHLAAPLPAQLREVAALLDIQVRQSPDGGFAHTSVVVLINEEGRPIARAEGDEGRSELVSALRR